MLKSNVPFLKMQEATLKFLLISLSLLFTFTSIASPANATKEFEDKLSTLLQSEELKPRELDIRTAETLHQFFSEDELSKISQKVSPAIALVEKNSRYSVYLPSLVQIKKILQAKSNDELLVSCQASAIPNHPLDKALVNLTNKICYKKFLNSLNTLNGKNLEFFEKNLFGIIQKDIIPELASMLNRVEKQAKVHEEISLILSKAYIQAKIIPESPVLKNMVISYDLTAFIQRAGYNKATSDSIFTGQLDDLIQKASQDLNKGNETLPKSLSAVSRYYKNNNSYLNSKMTKLRILSLARDLSRASMLDQSQDLFRLVMNDADIEISHEALFYMIWNQITNDKHKEALKFIEDQKLLDIYSTLSMKLKFWVAHTVELNKKKGLAIELYQQIIAENPLTYYAIVSIKNLTNLKDSQNIPSQFFKVSEGINPLKLHLADFSQNYIDALVRLKLWDRFNTKELSRAEILMVTNADVNFLKAPQTEISNINIKEGSLILMASVFSANNNYIAGFAIIQQALAEKKIAHNTALLKALFPNLYHEDIKKLDGDIDPIILLSLIRQESGFNPRARSVVGARGLMQIMPTTAKLLNRRVKANDLEKPDTNLKLGIQYFKYLMKKYDNNLVYVLSAYNAGENRVTRWQRDIFKSDSMLHTIEMIPFNETRDYVKLIFRNMYFYKLLANNTLDDKSNNHIYDINLGFKR